MNLKKIIKNIFYHFGLQITRNNKIFNDSHKYFISAYEAALLTLLSYKHKIKIVIVGANDGVINDPIYYFINKYVDRTEILLIEPQRSLIPILESNYSFHSNKVIFNGAIGPGEIIKLYSINPKIWKYLETPPHAKGWPEYRAPTGVTSTDKSHVENYLRKFLKIKIEIQDVIIKENIKCFSLISIIKNKNFSKNIDVLQIDAEGFDDEVIFNSNIDILFPNIILFETASLSQIRFDKLKNYLESLGYLVINLDLDSMAILTQKGED